MGHALEAIRIIFHGRKQYINPFCRSEITTSISEIADIHRAIRLEWLIVNHLYMTLFAILIWQEANLDDTPFLAIYQLASVLLTYILWNLTFVQFDTHIWNAETLHILHKVYVDDETTKQGQVLTCKKFLLNGCWILRNHQVKETCKPLSVEVSVKVDVSLQQEVLNK